MNPDSADHKKAKQRYLAETNIRDFEDTLYFSVHTDNVLRIQQEPGKGLRLQGRSIQMDVYDDRAYRYTVEFRIKDIPVQLDIIYYPESKELKITHGNETHKLTLKQISSGSMEVVAMIVR